VRAVLRREPADSVPDFTWFHPTTAQRLAALLEVPPSRVGEATGNDTCQAWVNNNYAMQGIIHQQDGDGLTDAWGTRWVKRYHFNQIQGFPPAGATREQVLAYRFPRDQVDTLLAAMLPVTARAGDVIMG
jgi:hypothetical protein